MKAAIERGSLVTAAALLVHYVCFYVFSVRLLPEVIGEWIMARTPNDYSVYLLETMGAWAKPFALTGGLFCLGAGVTFVAWLQRAILVVPVAMFYWLVFGEPAPTFWIPALLLLGKRQSRTDPFSPARRWVLSGVMSATAIGVALEAYWREARLAARATSPVALWPFVPPPASFHRFARPAITPLGAHYTMSKNSVDPFIDPVTWRLRLTVDGRERLSLSYAELLHKPREQRYVTLRCISNTLRSDLMGTAQWSGFPLRDLLRELTLPDSIQEVALLGVDRHGDSLALSYALSEEVFLAVGMNGKSLERAHGFPIRVLCPRYYGLKSVKWLHEIALVSQPYFGTWPKMGYTKEPLVKTASLIDRITEHEIVGVSFSGTRGIQAVEVRLLDGAGKPGPWQAATLDIPLSPYSWTRWKVELPHAGARYVEARAQDSTGAWQATAESPLFPSGVEGPTVRKISI